MSLGGPFKSGWMYHHVIVGVNAHGKRQKRSNNVEGVLTPVNTGILNMVSARWRAHLQNGNEEGRYRPASPNTG